MTTRNVPADKGAERALEIVDDFTKLLITLAAGAAALSVTFIGSVYRGHKLGLLAVAWGLLALSLLCGMLARGTYIGQVAVGRTEVRRGLLEILNSAQLLALIAAVALFGATVLLNLHSGPKILALRDAAKVDSGGLAVLPLACRTGDTGGCNLRIRVAGAGATGPLRVAQVAADKRAGIHVRLPRELRSRARADGQARGTVTVTASGRNGVDSTTELPMRFVAEMNKTERP